MVVCLSLPSLLFFLRQYLFKVTKMFINVFASTTLSGLTFIVQRISFSCFFHQVLITTKLHGPSMSENPFILHLFLKYRVISSISLSHQFLPSILCILILHTYYIYFNINKILLLFIQSLFISF